MTLYVRSGWRSAVRVAGFLSAGVLLLASCGGTPDTPSTSTAVEEPENDDQSDPDDGSDETPAFETVKVTYMMPHSISISYVEALIAQEKGFFDEFGLDVDIRGSQGTATAIQGVLGGSVDISRTNAINAITSKANEGADIVSIGTVRQRSQFDVVSLPENPINSAEELAGKVVGVVSAGGATENLLDMMLIQAGVDPGSVERPVTGVGTAAYELAKSGAIDAWIAVDTDRELVNNTIGEVNYFNSDQYLTIPSDTFNVSQETIDRDDDMPTRFLAAIIKAMEFGAQEDNWPEVVEILQKYVPEAGTEDSLNALPMLTAGWDADGEREFLEMPSELWEGGVKAMLDAGFIEQAVPTSELMTTKYIDAARELLN